MTLILSNREKLVQHRLASKAARPHQLVRLVDEQRPVNSLLRALLRWLARLLLLGRLRLRGLLLLGPVDELNQFVHATAHQLLAVIHLHIVVQFGAQA